MGPAQKSQTASKGLQAQEIPFGISLQELVLSFIVLGG